MSNRLRMLEHLSDHDLSGLSDSPDLDVFFPPKPLMATSVETNLRRSPRKRGTVQQPSPHKKEASSYSSSRKLARGARPAMAPSAPTQPENPRKTESALKDIPLLPRSTTVSETLVTFNNRRSPSSPQRSLRLAHIDSITLSLKTLAMQEDDAKPQMPTRARRQLPSEKKGMTERSIKPPEENYSQTSRQTAGRKQKQIPHYTNRFVLKEAHCNDDQEDSNDEEEDAETDLSGFIVDDDAEISFHHTSALESDDESDDQWRPSKQVPQPSPRRRILQRGSPTRRRLAFGNVSEGESDKENCPVDKLSNVLKSISLGNKKATKGEIEVIDLTSSPAIPPALKLNPPPSLPSLQLHNLNSGKDFSLTSNPFKDINATLKFSPPSFKPVMMVPSKDLLTKQATDLDDDDQQEKVSEQDNARFKTPPATPPRSPSKLKSPSKLLSPSKRQAIPHSPHRQSMDAFWDHNVINEWNDEYSPKKVPAASPGKRGLARFQIWSDSEDEAEDNLLDSSDSLPSPCSSPRKSRSPMKSPEKEEKKRLLEQKRAAAVERKAFDAQKEQLALDLFRELDEKVANGQLATLSSTTGGVNIIWSKTLRSTAGRANWKRTVTKLSGSPVKGNPSSSDASVKVQHFASIELAEKIIDCEDRLVNTLAHEFCHLTNFMISNVRDQPHGASFKKWAHKVTSHLRATHVATWREVEVTTKHSYVINHKYLWVCTGRPRSLAMEFLNVDDDEGCGAEYGRHSKSIDVEKHRCGKCKGMLVQVRPKPRGAASPAKKPATRRGVKREGSAKSSSSSGSQTGGLGALIETIELSD